MVTRILILFSAAIFTSCFLVKGKDERLTFKKEPYLGSGLRLSGFYHAVDSSTHTGPLFFLYRDGILLDLGAYRYDEVNLIRERMKKSFEKYHQNPAVWCLFKIENDSIHYEKLYPGANLEAVIRSGKIINDSTFVILRSKNSHGPANIDEEYTVFHFKSFSPKPDSSISSEVMRM